MSSRLVIYIALVLAGTAGGAAAQRANEAQRQRQPAATNPQPGTTTAGQQRRRPANQPAQARPASGGLNLDLNAGNRTVNGATRRPGDAFAVSGPYATDAQMQRYTGRRQIQVPRAPIQMFQQDETDGVTGYRR